jgi:lysophospholipase L1-like esterase
MEPTARNLQAGEQLASQAGARFVALFIDDRGNDFERDRKALQARLDTLGVPWVAADDLLPQGNWNKLSYPIDGHWNAAGHERVGKELAARIRPLLAAAR